MTKCANPNKLNVRFMLSFRLHDVKYVRLTRNLTCKWEIL